MRSNILKISGIVGIPGNFKQKLELPALLQGGTICLVFLVKNQNDRIRTERGVAIVL